MHLFIQEQRLQIGDATLSAWVIPVPSDFEYAFKEFQSFAKDRIDIKMKKEDDMLYVAEKVSVPRISALRADMMAYAFNANGHSDLAFVYKLGYDLSLNTELWPADMGNLRSITKEFMLQLYSEFYSDSIAVLEKDLKNLEKEKSSMVKDRENNIGKISKNQKSLTKEKDQIKIADLEAEVTSLTRANENITRTLPEMDEKIGKVKMKITALKHEMVEVQNAIGAI